MAVDTGTVESGLDALTARSDADRASWLRRVAEVVLPKVLAIGVVLGVWQLVVSLHLLATYQLPAPSDVWGTFSDQLHQGHITGAVWTSLSRAAVGYAVALVLGTPLGLLVARVRAVRLAIGSLLAGLQSLPSVTWVPFAIVLFGPGAGAIYFVVILGALPSIAMGTTTAVDGVPPLLPRVGRVLGARGIALYRYVILPAALPGYVGGLKQAWAFSWRSLMAAELITQSADLGLGLGQLLDSGRQTLDMTLVIATILVILAVGVAVDALVFSPLDRGIRRRRGLDVA